MLDAAEEDGNDEVYDRMNCAFGIFVEAKLTLDAMPTIDAVPVVHGEWIKHNNPNYSPFDNSGEYLYQCNKCGMVEYRARHYCPNCGARMDGKEKTK